LHSSRIVELRLYGDNKLLGSFSRDLVVFQLDKPTAATAASCIAERELFSRIIDSTVTFLEAGSLFLATACCFNVLGSIFYHTSTAVLEMRSESLFKVRRIR
jgi:hypothetical protein